MIIYKATNKINKMSYIGQTTTTLSRRIQKHASYSKKDDQFFHRALKKYGINNFDWSVIKECENIQALNISEKYYILFFNTKKPYGYNLTDGGRDEAPFKGHKHSEETKNRIKKRLREIHSQPEVREKMSKAHIGKKHTEIIKNKIGIASRKWHEEHPNNNGLIGKNHPLQGKGGTFLGKHHSEEAKKKIREKRKQWFRQNPGIYDGSKNPNWRQDNA